MPHFFRFQSSVGGEVQPYRQNICLIGLDSLDQTPIRRLSVNVIMHLCWCKSAYAGFTRCLAHKLIFQVPRVR